METTDTLVVLRMTLAALEQAAGLATLSGMAAAINADLLMLDDDGDAIDYRLHARVARNAITAAVAREADAILGGVRDWSALVCVTQQALRDDPAATAADVVAIWRQAEADHAAELAREDRRCVCGRTLGVHLAAAPHPYYADEPNCAGFRPATKTR